jgi:hypothetical protein
MRVRPAFPLLSLCAVLACAKMEPPPGGPPDLAPPQLLTTRPDSLAQMTRFTGYVEFRFDEMISEGGTPNRGNGTGGLEKLVILSPTARFPDVGWHRSRITVKPSEGWQPNRVYRVELLPGVTDLRRNRSDRGKVVTFTTGAPLPDRTLQGVVVDWSTNRPAPLALVEALLVADSLAYRGLTDSSGHFSLGPLPAGTYLVKGVIDQNHDFRSGEREAFDSLRIEAKDTLARVGELWTFVHDTTGPRIRTITVGDSLSAIVAFSQLLDPRQHLDAGAVTLRLLPDSSRVEVTSLLPQPVDDSLQARTHVIPDSAARADTAMRKDRPRGPEAGARTPQKAAAQPLTSRPRLSDQLVVRVSSPWTPDAKYELEIQGVRNVSGVAGEAKGVLAVPGRETRDSLKKRS